MTTSHKLFVALCEEILPEVSTSFSLIGNHPGAKELIKMLHQQKGLSHKQEYSQIGKISWNDIKSNYRGSWVLIKGTKGTGAIKWSGSTYEAAASDGNEPQEYRSDRGGNILEFLEKNIGKLKSFYSGAETGVVNVLKDKRSQQKASLTPRTTAETLLNKFKPLWERAMVAAMADIKGMVSTMIKNDSYEKARKKIAQLEELEAGLDKIQSGGEAPSFLEQAVSLGVMMAAAHYYPEDTGEITRRYGSTYSSTNLEGSRKLLADITKGDTKKLSTVLGFFKRALITR